MSAGRFVRRRVVARACFVHVEGDPLAFRQAGDLDLDEDAARGRRGKLCRAIRLAFRVDEAGDSHRRLLRGRAAGHRQQR